MNTKRKLANLILVGGLAIATWAFAQTAFKADGIIESTQGGFKFPDQSVQTTAYSSPIEYYRQIDYWNGSEGAFRCYFDVPPGKILIIERVSGKHEGEGDHLDLNHMFVDRGVFIVYLLPTVSEGVSSNDFIFDAKTVEYMEDSNSVTDGQGSARDFSVVGIKRLLGTNFTYAECVVVGRLYDAPIE